MIKDGCSKIYLLGGQKYITIETSYHNDISFSGYPPLPKGEVVMFLTEFKNFYGDFIRVITKNDLIYNLKFDKVRPLFN